MLLCPPSQSLSDYGNLFYQSVKNTFRFTRFNSLFPPYSFGRLLVAFCFFSARSLFTLHPTRPSSISVNTFVGVIMRFSTMHVVGQKYLPCRAYKAQSEISWIVAVSFPPKTRILANETICRAYITGSHNMQLPRHIRSRRDIIFLHQDKSDFSAFLGCSIFYVGLTLYFRCRFI